MSVEFYIAIYLIVPIVSLFAAGVFGLKDEIDSEWFSAIVFWPVVAPVWVVGYAIFGAAYLSLKLGDRLHKYFFKYAKLEGEG